MKDTLLCGDCAEKMRTLADNSIDAIVSDPPYGLAFMGADFDTFHAEGKSDNLAFQESMTPIFAEALRVAKPGAHLLAFGGTRTYHRLACAIEDAGWEIRDCIMWVYGSGFPKSMDVAKAIDKASGYEGEVIGSRIVDVGMQGGNMHAGRKQQQQQQIRALSPEAAAWNGWGTALKPAVEPIVIARKPLEGTVAANVLKYGTGALNIDESRVPLGANDALQKGIKHDGKVLDTHKAGWGFKNVDRAPGLGRYPANLLHDGSQEVHACFPDVGKSSGGGLHTKGKGNNNQGVAYGKFANAEGPDKVGFGDSGSAARFFNCLRDGEASAERRYTEKGNTNFAMKPGMRRPPTSPVRFFYCAKASRSERGEGNVHPTVKPLALMRWLITLVTPPGGTVLDPFMGSGTTGVAARQLDRPFVGIERDPHYYEIASRRVNDAKPIPPTTTQQELPL